VAALGQVWQVGRSRGSRQVWQVTWFLPGSRAPPGSPALLCTRLNHADHRRLRVPLFVADTLIVRAELTVEQHVTAHSEYAVARPMTFAERRRRLQANGGTPVADEQRGNGHVQPIQQAGLEKHRDGDATPLDEYSCASARAQQAQHLREVELIRRSLNAGNRRVAECPRPRLDERPRAEIQRRSGWVGEHAVVIPQPAAGIQDDTERIRTADEPGGELRIVERDRGRTYHDSVT
jgi:hypothetical protein